MLRVVQCFVAGVLVAGTDLQARESTSSTSGGEGTSSENVAG